MKEINLEEIFNKEYSFCPAESLTVTQKEFVLYTMREACKQVLELAAEHAQIEIIKIEYGGVRAGGYFTEKVVDKQSILDTIKQVKP